MSNTLRPHEWQHARPPCPSPTPGVHKDGNCLLQDIFKSVEAGDSCPLLTRSWGSALRPRGMAFCSPFPRILPVLVFLQAGFWVTVRFASLPLTQTVAVITFIRARGPSVIAGLQSGAGRRRPELAWRIPCRWAWAVCGWPMGCEQEQTPSARCPVSPGLSRDTHGDHEGPLSLLGGWNDGPQSN